MIGICLGTNNATERRRKNEIEMPHASPVVLFFVATHGDLTKVDSE